MSDQTKPPPVGERLFQINETDLATLEREVPALLFRAMKEIDSNDCRVKFRQIQRIITDVRWHYGPWGQVTVIPADGETPAAEGGGA